MSIDRATNDESAGPGPGFYNVALPAKLLPNRGPNFAILAVLAGAMIFAALQFDGLGLSTFGFSIDIAPTPSSAAPDNRPMSWLGGGLIALVMIFCIWREFAYFRSGGSYFFGLSQDGVTVSSPLVLREFPWQRIERFRVVSKHRRARYGGRRSSYSVRADLREGGWFSSGVTIPQADFAKDVGPDNAESAEILCTFLNDVRDRVREAAGGEAIVPVPDGLQVIEWPQAKGQAPAMGDAPADRTRDVGRRTPTVTRQ